MIGGWDGFCGGKNDTIRTNCKTLDGTMFTAQLEGEVQFLIIGRQATATEMKD